MTTAQKLPEGLEPVAWSKVRKDHMPRMRMLNDSYLQGAWDVPLVRLSDAQAALLALAAEKEAEIAALKEKAARYDWLREQAEPNRGGEKPWCTVRDSKGHAWAFGGSLDAAIDSALALAAKEAK
jgi:hypothetical protein